MDGGVNDEQVAQLVEITQCSIQEAEFLLGASGGDLALAIELYKGKIILVKSVIARSIDETLRDSL
jgi:hypothetical protein